MQVKEKLTPSTTNYFDRKTTKQSRNQENPIELAITNLNHLVTRENTITSQNIACYLLIEFI